MKKKPNIFLIITDSLRFDHLSCNGYSRQTTPNIDAFSKKSTVFTKAYTPAPWTLPSHATLFTGLYPSEHQLVSGYKGITPKLSSNIPTLAEILSDHGYMTIGLSSNPWVGEKTDLNRGFDLYSEYNYKISSLKQNITLPAIWKLFQIASRIPKIRTKVMRRHHLISNLYLNTIIDIMSKNVNGQGEKKPVFSFVNIMNPHNPYLPHVKYLKKFSDLKYPYRYNYWDDQFNKYIQGKIVSDDNLRSQLNNFYDASIYEMDVQLGAFLKSLNDLGLMDNSIVIVTADHGKTLGEYERKEYPLHYMTDVNRHIPLMVYGAESLEPGIKDNVCSLQDIYKFVMEETGISELEKADEEKYRVSLSDRLNTEKYPFAFTEVKIPYAGNEDSSINDVYCIDDGRYSFLSNSSQDNILWDRTKDPSQVRDFSSEEPEISMKLSEELAAWIEFVNNFDTQGHETQDEANRETMNRLKDLGYL